MAGNLAATQVVGRDMRWDYGSTKQLAWAHGLVILRMLIFGAVLLGVLRPLLTADLPRKTGSNPELLEQAILALMAVGFVLLFLVKIAKVTWKDLGFSREGLRRNLLTGVAVFAAGLVVIAVRFAIDGDPVSDIWQAAIGYSTRQRLVIVLVGIHVVFGEEVLFRGYLQPGLRARFGPALAIGITSLIFAAYHVNFSPMGFLGNVLWGVIWGLARERSGSTVPSSVAHFLNWSVLGWL
ncbi:MAG: CPBP family intramembrane metalloprotease [Deltaproteobacteria bacterium]|nr:CPBP family intramembrane metalloprotease [Deltaproteobacteria bacterium]